MYISIIKPLVTSSSCQMDGGLVRIIQQGVSFDPLRKGNITSVVQTLVSLHLIFHPKDEETSKGRDCGQKKKKKGRKKEVEGAR